MERELDNLIKIYGLDALRSYLSEKKDEEKCEGYNRDWNINYRKFERLGLRKDDLGVVFYSNGEPFKVTGLKLANRKYPLLADRVRDGRKFKFTIECLTTTRKVEELKKTLLEEIKQEAS